MEKYIILDFDGFLHLVKYTGNSTVDEIEDAFSSFLEKTDDDMDFENIIKEVMETFGKYEIVEARHLMF